MNEVVVLKNDDEIALTHEITEFWKVYEQAPIVSQDEYEIAAARRTVLKDHLKKLHAVKKGHTMPISQLMKAVMDFFGTFEGYLADAQRKIDGEMLIWNAALKRDRETEQKKLEVYATLSAEEEKKKLESAALHALGKGDEARAIELVQKADEVKASIPILAPVKAKAEGVTIKKCWKYRIVNLNQVPEEFWKRELDEAKLTKYAKAMGESAKVEGVEFYCEEIVSQTRR